MSFPQLNLDLDSPSVGEFMIGGESHKIQGLEIESKY